jgi:hypothetical protein
MLNQKIFFKHHLGMGDAIVHNGMVRKYLQDHPATQIFIPSKFENTEDMDAYVNGYPFPSSKYY